MSDTADTTTAPADTASTVASQAQPAQAEPASQAPSQAPAQTSPLDAILNPDGTFRDGWNAAYENPDALGKYKTLPDLIAGFDNAQKLIGRKMASVPTETSTPEQIAAFREAYGAPADASGYERPAYMTSDEEFKPYAAIADKYHLPVKAVSELFAEQTRQGQEEWQRQTETLQAHLKEKFGADYERNVKLLEETARKLGIDETDQFQIAAMRNPVVADLIWEKARLEQEGTLHNNNPALARTVEEQTRFQELIRKCGGNIAGLDIVEKAEYKRLLEKMSKPS